MVAIEAAKASAPAANDLNRVLFVMAEDFIGLSL
jgi:hypothetical protein